MKDNNYQNPHQLPIQDLKTYGERMKPNGISILDRNHPVAKQRSRVSRSSPVDCQIQIMMIRLYLTWLDLIWFFSVIVISDPFL